MTQRELVVKAASPDQIDWRHRISQQEGAIVRAFLTWIQQLHATVSQTDIAEAIVMRSAAAVEQLLQAVAFNPNVAVIAQEEATLDFNRTVQQIDAALHLSLNLRDPHFQAVVELQQAQLVREVTDETRRAIVNLVARAYRDGLHPDLVAPQLYEAVGLTARQAQAVLNYSEALTRKGFRPDVVADRAIRYARRMRKRRALLIGRTSTVQAMVQGRLLSYQQAADQGLFDTATAELEWSSVQADPAEICAQLDGERVPFGDSWDGMLPGFVHPGCRCSCFLVIN